MNWKNLKENKCPKCGKDFMMDLATYPVAGTQMLAHGCGFKIREAVYSKIVNSQVNATIEERLNNNESEEI